MVAAGRLGRKSGQGFYDYARRPPNRDRPIPRTRSRGRRVAERAPTLDPATLAEDRPRRAADPPPPARPDRQRGGLRARRGSRLPGRHGHRDAARLQLAARPAGAHRADRRRARRVDPRGAASSARRGLRAGAAADEPQRNRDRDWTTSRQARRGLIAPFDPPRVENADGRTVWELESYDFLDGEPPETANPSLWRQARLSRIAGLFELAPGLYQLRGFDLSNMHVVEGDRRDRRHRPTRLRRDRRGGARPLPRAPRRASRHRPGLHPQPRRPLRRRQGRRLRRRRSRPAASRSSPRPASSTTRSARTSSPARRWGGVPATCTGRCSSAVPTGQLGAGLGQTTSLGTITLIPPNLEMTETGQEETVDGVRMRFQLTPGTEAPAEMNIHFPETRALCIADNAPARCTTSSPRAARWSATRAIWAHYLDEAIELFGAESDVLFAGHHWPCWGGERIVDYLEKQRDLYTYLHDQTLRLMNQGLDRTGDRRGDRAAAEPRRGVALPRVLRLDQPQRQGDLPALHGLVRRQPGPPLGAPAGRAGAPLRRVHGRRRCGAGEGPRSLRAGRLPLGGRGRQPRRLRRARQPRGPRAAGRRARAARLRRRERDLAQLLPDGRPGAARGDLRHADGDRAAPTSSPTSRSASCSTRWRSGSTARAPGTRTCASTGRIADPDEQHRITVRNGVLRHRPGSHEPAADAALVVDREALDQLLLKTADVAELAESGRLRVEGDGVKLGELLGLLDEPDPGFAIVTPD